VSSNDLDENLEAIAVVGMSGRFPGCRNLDEYWQQLMAGEELITFFSDEELTGVDAATLADPRFVKARAVLQEVEMFDADFFGLGAREAKLLDPQHRLFLECAWEALEAAGYAPERAGEVGVYASASSNSYLDNHVLKNPRFHDPDTVLQAMLGNDRDFLSTRVSYKLNLTGPSFDVQTACSSSLVAIHLACQGLLSYQCEMALAGGVAVKLPQVGGHIYQEGGIFSPDGHCRVFDAEAAGTVGGSGVGVVALKRLDDALEARDPIHAVVLASAINNDGSDKLGYTAPSAPGQAEVVATALALAGVDADTISYVEAHGTGTPLGDPIEVAALTQAFRATTSATGFCALGSVKSNLGHLDAAAGVAGFIKTVLALRHRSVPASLHFTAPNPKIDFASSPFYVAREGGAWQSAGPRRAGVSSFGIGGTNAHVILEEAPERGSAAPAREWHLLQLSARSEAALERASQNLADYLQRHPDSNLADVSYTLSVGRKDFAWRRLVVCQEVDDARVRLVSEEPRGRFDGRVELGARPVAFLFPGQGAQYGGMGRELYEQEPAFREHFDHCAERLLPHLGEDLRSVVHPREDGSSAEAGASRLDQTRLTQPALFAVEYALAQMWMKWGVEPAAMLGHSVGEVVAATLAGVMSLDDALTLIAERGRLMQELPTGAMLSVPLPAADLEPLLTAASESLSFAAINGPRRCVVAGSHEETDHLLQILTERGVQGRRLHTSHAFHSASMEPMLEPFLEVLRSLSLAAPRIPFLSNVTGTWIRDEEATSPEYWVRHVRQPVRFSDGAAELLRDGERILLEVGPGNTLATLIRRQPGWGRQRPVLPSLPRAGEEVSSQASMLIAAGRLWLAGVALDGAGLYAHQDRRRLELPTYPFERHRYWIEPGPGRSTGRAESATTLPRRAELTEWFYAPVWQQRPPVVASPGSLAGRWLVFLDPHGLGAEVVRELRRMGHEVITVEEGEGFEVLAENAFRIAAASNEDSTALIAECAREDRNPDRVLHLWCVSEAEVGGADRSTVERGFHSLIALVQALAPRTRKGGMEITVVSSGAFRVVGDEELSPAKATARGPLQVVPQEFPELRCRHVDIVLAGVHDRATQAARLVEELTARATSPTVALRGGRSWEQHFVPVEDIGQTEATWRSQGVYVITGGLGGLGLALAEHLAQEARARLVLLSRRAVGSEVQQRLDDLAETGAETLVLRADVTDRRQLAGALHEARRRFGRLDGVLHAAGLAGRGVIETRSRESLDQVLAPKVVGATLLVELLRDDPPDFLVLFSSLSSILGGAGQVDYCAANAFLDALAQSEQRNGRRWVSAVHWDTWREAGMAVAAASRAGVSGDALAHGLSTAEGGRALLRLLALGEPQIAVSTRDLPTLIALEGGTGPAAAESEGAPGQYARPEHARPELDVEYTPARTHTESILVAIWQEVLGVAPVGIDDDFAELGGDSLIATQICSRVRKELRVDLPLKTLLDAPTVWKLAQVVEAGQVEATDGGVLADVLTELDGLSEEEVAVLLAEREES